MNNSRPSRGKLLSLVLAVILTGILLVTNRPTKSAVATVLTQHQPGLYTVTHVDDGDTIVVSDGSHKETVRFLGMDTPEVVDPRKPVQCFGPEASAETKKLLTNQKVRLASDPLDSDRDKYGRLLRYVYLPDGTFINAKLVQDGYAFAYTIFPLTKLTDFEQWQAQAKAAGVGLWSACNVDSSSQILQTAGPKT